MQAVLYHYLFLALTRADDGIDPMLSFRLVGDMQYYERIWVWGSMGWVGTSWISSGYLRLRECTALD